MKMFPHQFDLQNIRLFKLLISFSVLFCFAASASAIGICTVSRYNTSPLIPAGVSPKQVLAGNLNDDAKPDLVVLTGSSSGSSNVVTVLLNNGRGSYQPFTSIALNFSAASIKLADFNQDGNLDLVAVGTSNFSNGTSPIAVYFNNGAGVFSTQNNYTVQGSAAALDTGDFNSDGTIDIAVGTVLNNSFGVIALLTNDGSGNFNFVGNFSVGGTPRDLKTADFNSDGISDIVTINTNGTGSLFLGSNSGNFQVATNFIVNSNQFSSSLLIAVGDLNNDNRPDLVISSLDSTSFVILINNGGNFGAPVQTNFTDFNLRVRSLTVGQVVGDANADIVIGVGGSFSDSVSEVAVFQGNGNGTFNTANPIISPTGASPVSVIIADLNEDNFNDIVTANSFSGDISVLINNNNKIGPNTFPNVANSGVIAVADFDGDGNLDTVTGASQTSGSNIMSILILFGNGMGGVSRTQPVGLANPIQSIIATDFNNDSRPDLIIAFPSASNNTSTVNVYLNSGSNSAVFNSIPSSSAVLSFTVKDLVIGDFNNDNIKDIVASSTFNNSITLILGTQTGVFGSQTSFAAPVNSPTVTVGDFNNDSNLDLAVAGSTSSSSGTGAIFTLLGNGNGTFSQVNESVSVSNPNSIASGDFNGDSLLDVAVTNPTSTFSGSSSAVVIAFGVGGGRFSQPTSYPVGLDARAITAADFNGDSRPDLIVINRGSNSFSVLINLGNGSFASANNFLAGVTPESIAIGDFNNDGRNDVATANRRGNNFSLITNSCLEAVTKTDYNSEGKSDFAVFRPSNGTWYVLSSDLRNVKSQQFGTGTDIPTPGDYDGDGATDFAVFRPSNGTWYIFRSSTNRSFAIQFGAVGDIPVANDYDGDGRTDIAVFRPSNGTWYIRRSSTSQSQINAFQFGNNTDRPVPADYDGDGRADLAVYRDGLWIILKSSDSSVSYQSFGIASDTPVIGDYDGDGKSDLAVYRGGVWYILQSKTTSLRVEGFGVTSDRPQPADYDGDGRTDIAVFRPSESNWYVLLSTDRQVRSVSWGTSNDIPVTSLYRY